MKTYYAKLWNCGRGAVRANTGHNQVEIVAFETRAERDAAVREYRAPNHCPSAAMEAVRANDVDVRRYQRELAAA